MINTNILVICIICAFVLAGGNFIPKPYVFATIITYSEESDFYMKLSDVLDDTKNNLSDVVQAINSGQKDNALNIISNITTNINEIENGLDLLENNPISGGD